MIAVEKLAEVFVEVADTLIDDFDVIEFLEMLTIRTADMSHAASAGLLLVDAHGQLQFMAASQESVKLLELFQIQNEEGPCMECFRNGAAVVNTDLQRARAAGHCSARVRSPPDSVRCTPSPCDTERR